MGNCCGGEDDSKNQITNTRKAGKGANAGNSAVLDDDNGDILSYCNQKVREIHENSGDYKEGSFDAEGAKIETRPVASLQNNAKYEGEWNSKDDTRHGYGVQVWSDGSMYQGYWKADQANG